MKKAKVLLICPNLKGMKDGINRIQPSLGLMIIAQKLIDDGHQIFIWSGVGLRSDDMNRLDLMDLVSGIFVKPITDFEIGLERFGVRPRPDFVIDDHREIVEAFGGVHIEPYYFRSAEDGHMNELYHAIKQYHGTGSCDHRGFKAVPQEK